MIKALIVISLFSCSMVSSDYIRIYKAGRCNNKPYYPVIIDDVKLEVKNGYSTMSGSLTSDVDILSPVKAELVVKRYIRSLNIWVAIPCVNGVGSCTYYNLCTWGAPQDSTCPYVFDRDNVPCRCPIPKGAYTLKPGSNINSSEVPEKLHAILEQLRLSSPASGTYYVHAHVTHGNQFLTCYTFYVDYYDGSQVEDSIEANEIVPFVKLTS